MVITWESMYGGCVWVSSQKPGSVANVGMQCDISQLGCILDNGHMLLSFGHVLESLWMQVFGDIQEQLCLHPVVAMFTVHVPVASFGLCAEVLLSP